MDAASAHRGLHLSPAASCCQSHSHALGLAAGRARSPPSLPLTHPPPLWPCVQLDALRGVDARSRFLLETRLYDRRLLQVGEAGEGAAKAPSGAQRGSAARGGLVRCGACVPGCRGRAALPAPPCCLAPTPLLQERLAYLRRVRAAGDVWEIAFAVRSDLIRNLANMTNRWGGSPA